MDAGGPDLGLGHRAGLEQLAGVDGGGQVGVVAQHAVDPQHVGHEVVGERGEPVEVVEATRALRRRTPG